MAGSALLVQPHSQRAGLSAYLVPIGIAIALAATLLFSASDRSIGVYWLIGIALGVILQRSRFCFAGAFRDLIMAGDGRLMRSAITGMLLASCGFALLMVRLVPDATFGSIPVGAHVTPVGLHLVLGGLAFGIGMVVAGGCVSGTLFRIGEGYVQAMVAMLGILVGLAFAAHTWNWWWTAHISSMPIVWMPNALGHGASFALTIVGLLALYVLVLWIETRGGIGGMSMPGKADPPAFTLSERIAAFREKACVQGWPALVGGLSLGALNIFSFVYAHPLGVTGELSAWAERASGLFGLGAGPLLGVDLFAGCNLALGDAGWLTSSFTLDAGLVVGAFLAASAAGEFKIRMPRRPMRFGQAIGGGVLMGYGAGIAIGCTIGAFFSAVPSLSLSGWVFGASLAVGAFLGTLIIRRIP